MNYIQYLGVVLYNTKINNINKIINYKLVLTLQIMMKKMSNKFLTGF